MFSSGKSTFQSVSRFFLLGESVFQSVSKICRRETIAFDSCVARSCVILALQQSRRSSLPVRVDEEAASGNCEPFDLAERQW